MTKYLVTVNHYKMVVDSFFSRAISCYTINIINWCYVCVPTWYTRLRAFSVNGNARQKVWWQVMRDKTRQKISNKSVWLTIQSIFFTNFNKTTRFNNSLVKLNITPFHVCPQMCLYNIIYLENVEINNEFFSPKKKKGFNSPDFSSKLNEAPKGWKKLDKMQILSGISP